MYCILVNSFKDKNIYISTLWSNSKVSEKNNNNNNLFLVFLAVLRFLTTGFNVNISNIRISFHQKHLVKKEPYIFSMVFIILFISSIIMPRKLMIKLQSLYS